MNVFVFQCCCFLAFGMIAGAAFDRVLEQRMHEQKAAFLISLPLEALQQIEVDA